MKFGGQETRAYLTAQYKALAKAYGPLGRLSRQRPVDVLVRTILSQNTSDTNSDRAYGLLRRKFPKWTQVMTAGPHVLARTIHCAGLANIKAGYIRKALKTIHEREGKLDLNRLKTLNTDDALAYLTSLTGVGVKTACCVLLFGFGRPVMPVDTHVYRVARRLGWVGADTPINDVHEILERMIPGHRILPMHLYVIRHGRTLCRPQNPDCRHCPISRHCVFFREIQG